MATVDPEVSQTEQDVTAGEYTQQTFEYSAAATNAEEIQHTSKQNVVE
jgi:hypothetical protein